MRLFLYTMMVLIYAGLASNTSANLVTFPSGSLPFFGEEGSFTEDGINVTAQNDIPNTGAPSPEVYRWSRTFAMQSRFNPVSFDINHNINLLLYVLYKPEDDTYVFLSAFDYSDVNPDYIDADPLPYDNLLVQGYRNNALVAEDTFYSDDLSTYFFDPKRFNDLDFLSITRLAPDYSVLDASVLLDYPGYFVEDRFCQDQPCSVFSIDNVALTPVPLPASLPLFIIGLSALSCFVRRDKHVVNAVSV